jgi:NAD-dependent deacetylase
MLSKEIKNYIKNNLIKGKVVCLTGAGVSAESGIPTFRGKGGLWERYDPQVYGYPEGLVSTFKAHPEKIVNFMVDFYTLLLEARPNPSHLALSALEREGVLSSIITQNIDNLHQQAGSRSVIELHGNAYRIRCPGCSKTIILEKDRLREMVNLLKKYKDSRIRILKIFSRYFPRCSCGSRYRIDIVLFGEMLPEGELSRAYQQLDNCRMLLLVGSSLVVYPAASLPLYAKERGAKLIEINNQPSALSNFCDYQIKGRASEVLSEILSMLHN